GAVLRNVGDLAESFSRARELAARDAASAHINLLKDMYYAEKQILKALPKMAKRADSDELRRAFQHHLKETKGQVQRLWQIFGLWCMKALGKNLRRHQGHPRRGRGGHEGGQGASCLDDQHDRRRSSGRALRDSALWHVDRVGQSARYERRRAAAPADHRSGV